MTVMKIVEGKRGGSWTKLAHNMYPSEARDFAEEQMEYYDDTRVVDQASPYFDEVFETVTAYMPQGVTTVPLRDYLVLFGVPADELDIAEGAVLDAYFEMPEDARGGTALVSLLANIARRCVKEIHADIA